MSSSSKLSYLQRYLAKGQSLPQEGAAQTEHKAQANDKKKKKKKKDKEKKRKDVPAKTTRMRIFDVEDGVPGQHGGDKDKDEEDDRHQLQEEMPQVAGFVDERPEIEIMKERFTTSSFQAVVKKEDDLDVKPEIKTEPRDSDDADADADREPDRRQLRRHDSSDDDGGRQGTRPRHDSSDESPPRRRRRRRHDSSGDDDETSRRDNRRHDSSGDEDAAGPPKRRRHDSSDEEAPTNRRGNRRHDSSGENGPPPNSRDNRRHDDSDASPPRIKREPVDSDVSSPRVKSEPVDSDASPPRRRKDDDDLSPPRRRQAEVKEEPDSDASPPRRRMSPTQQQRTTLDGKKAGLQDAKSLKKELNEIKEKERDMFSKLSSDVSGRDADTRVRGRLKEKAEEEQRKKEQNEITEEVKEKYSRWSKGVMQARQIEQRIAEDLHEMDKPLARTKDDADLDAHLKQIEREEDPMLNYLRKKKAKAKGKKGVPVYSGSAPPPLNRFSILPGYRWDGVDRSTGFEKKLFARQNARKALEEDRYKWSTEDM